MELEDIIKDENIVFKKTKLLNDKPLSYCPGCGHGTVHRILMETIEELGIDEETIGIAPVGCAVMAYEFMEIDMQEAAHGRAPALATGIKRVYPNKYVFTYQGDGDLAAIGTAETMHCCNRGENILIIFINNGIYGMTGGQMAPTTLEGAKTSTLRKGRFDDGLSDKNNGINRATSGCKIRYQTVGSHSRRRQKSKGCNKESL